MQTYFTAAVQVSARKAGFLRSLQSAGPSQPTSACLCYPYLADAHCQPSVQVRTAIECDTHTQKRRHSPFRADEEILALLGAGAPVPGPCAAEAACSESAPEEDPHSTAAASGGPEPEADPPDTSHASSAAARLRWADQPAQRPPAAAAAFKPVATAQPAQPACRSTASTALQAPSSLACCVQPASAPPLQRCIEAQTSFSSAAEYQRLWERAVYEELNIRCCLPYAQLPSCCPGSYPCVQAMSDNLPAADT